MVDNTSEPLFIYFPKKKKKGGKKNSTKLNESILSKKIYWPKKEIKGNLPVYSLIQD